MSSSTSVTISPPNFQVAVFNIVGTAPYCQHRFWKKGELMDKMKQGSTAKKGAKRDPRDFEKDYEQSKHISDEGWIGIPAPSFRNAMVSACKIVGFHMTKAKLAVFIEQDGFSTEDMAPLVKIIGEPEMNIAPVRNATGVIDLRARPLWKKWGAEVRVRYDADMFTLGDITNLMVRVGAQVGIGEGRADSKKSTGVGWGFFRVEEDVELIK